MWKYDRQLKETMDKYVKEGLKRKEMLDFLVKNFPIYHWSTSTLDRRLRYFDIYYVDNSVDKEHVVEAVFKELEGPGQLLGYRAMHNKIRQIHDLRVSRRDVYAIMRAADPNGIKGREPCFKNKKKKGHYTSPDTNFVHSLDGHDKLMGYQNSTFPIAIYGCIDTCSRKLLWVKVWQNNSDETGIMAAMHAYLRQGHQDTDALETVIYGPSTSNQIERWWRELHERLEKFFKLQLNLLLDSKKYDPHNELHRSLLAYIMVPVMQTNIDEFVHCVWNTHRIRDQKDTKLPCGIPNHIGLNECGVSLDVDDLEEAATASGVLDADQDYIEPAVREACQKIIPDPEKLHPATCGEAFINLVRNVAT